MADQNYMPWKFSHFFYILAIIILVIAIIVAIGAAATCDENDRSVHRNANVTWVFLTAIALGILAFVQQRYEKQPVSDFFTRKFNC